MGANEKDKRPAPRDFWAEVRKLPIDGPDMFLLSRIDEQTMPMADLLLLTPMGAGETRRRVAQLAKLGVVELIDRNGEVLLKRSAPRDTDPDEALTLRPPPRERLGKKAKPLRASMRPKRSSEAFADITTATKTIPPVRKGATRVRRP